mgnify:CR=1 FL=1
MPFQGGHKINIGNKYAVRRKPISDYYEIDQKTECWNWKHALGHNGYGLFWYKGSTKRAHRVFYEIFKGEVSKNMVVDHICRNRKCVNPDHLESRKYKERIGDKIKYE